MGAFPKGFTKNPESAAERHAMKEDSITAAFPLSLSGYSFKDALERSVKKVLESTGRSAAAMLASVMAALLPALSVSSFTDLFQGVHKP